MAEHKRYSLPAVLKGKERPTRFVLHRAEQAKDIRKLTDKVLELRPQRAPYGLVSRVGFLSNKWETVPADSYFDNIDPNRPLPDIYTMFVRQFGDHVRDTYIEALNNSEMPLKRYYGSLIGGIKTDADIMSATVLTAINGFKNRYRQMPDMNELRGISMQSTPFMLLLSNMYINRALYLMDHMRHGAQAGPFDNSMVPFDEDTYSVKMAIDWEALVAHIPIEHDITGCPAGVHKRAFDSQAEDDYSAIEDMWFFYLDTILPDK